VRNLEIRISRYSYKTVKRAKKAI